ncbi:DUF397 domain-containing protein [Rhizohabitans arisaemae]|uniref:DUF397 domain-containing protein n=1 Tax=Rhizohabitans arisaemae TaxID=2720610 RepID=UPI0024B03F23|nr:DUF397 domain-containing protein [Rhizohabitans arisaemae]
MAGPKEPGVTWRKSTASNPSNCVEVAFEGRAVFVRDSKNRAGPALEFSLQEWDAFLTGVRKGEFNGRPIRMH